MSLYLVMRPRVTKFCLWLYLVGLNQECPNYSPGDFGPMPGVTSFTRGYIGKTVEISLYLATRPRVSKFYLWLYIGELYQECPNYSLWIKFDPILGGHKFYMGLCMENFKISPCT